MCKGTLGRVAGSLGSEGGVRWGRWEEKTKSARNQDLLIPLCMGSVELGPCACPEFIARDGRLEIIFPV